MVWEVDAYPIRNDHGDTVQVIVAEQDVTHERKLQAQVAQKEKLAAIGEFAATFAHQMRNPLSAVIGNAQLLTRELDGDQREMAIDIADQGDMARKVLEDVMDFSRQENYRFEPTDANVIAREACDTIRYGLPENWAGELRIDLEQNLPPVRADADHLQHVLQNLLSNGRDALPEAGGCLTLVTRRHGDEVEILVRDNGSGIPKDKQAKIWEPFFTTKKRGKGTGLGLAYCKRVIKEHGGLIDVTSEVGQGTEFTITLPVYLNGR
jgi:two-component system NtrC family sensor kinase